MRYTGELRDIRSEDREDITAPPAWISVPEGAVGSPAEIHKVTSFSCFSHTLGYFKSWCGHLEYSDEFKARSVLYSVCIFS